jgi:hypothetical protein
VQHAYSRVLPHDADERYQIPDDDYQLEEVVLELSKLVLAAVEVECPVQSAWEEEAYHQALATVASCHHF